ncbi:hypothetical protein WG66_010861 [Moniliophthora roreri]|nr:hypothetical protein WG66_010861 [Moniliophthora roreri]
MTHLSSEKDTNFCFPIPDVLESEGVKLVPFIPSQHAQTVYDGLVRASELTQFLPIGPYESPEALVQDFWSSRLGPNPNDTLFVIFDKVTENTAAGFIALINSSAPDLHTEIGYVVIFKDFHRTHVASNAVGLLMHYALDLPEQGGLGLRRVQWMANALNAPSVGLAQKMGFAKEGILRWHRVLPPSKSVGHNGGGHRKGDPREGCGARDTAVLASYWDTWESGQREKVDEIMKRRVEHTSK